MSVSDIVNNRCVRLNAAGCLEAENAIGYFKSAGLQSAAGDAGTA